MISTAGQSQSQAIPTTNACKLCTPLGACLAFRGIAGAIPFLHGSQGCATYIRRYLISHFKEPLDVASSSFSETTAIFGGGQNFLTGLANVTAQYQPELIGVGTTCLSETIGDDISQFLHQYRKEYPEAASGPVIVPVSTPSFRGTHIDGFHAAVKAVVSVLAEQSECRPDQINLLPGFVSPADLRYLKEIVADFGLKYVLVPDYSETMDGPIWTDYQKIPAGGTPLTQIRNMGGSAATIEFGRTPNVTMTAGGWLVERYQVPRRQLGLPIGIKETDRFFNQLETVSGQIAPDKYRQERGRLIDSYVDGHKYVFEKRAVVYGEEDLVVGIASFLCEVGIIPVLCASGGKSGRLRQALEMVAPEFIDRMTIREGIDFMGISEIISELKPDLLIGNSKGYSISRELSIPLIRLGFPIHDRLGGQRVLHLGYRGAQELFDRIVNTLIQVKQDGSPVGYSYM